MFFIEPVLLGVSLAMDALAVSLALGAVERNNFNWRKILATALSFGVFQSLMPTVGWLGGSLFGSLVQTYGRYVAALLLFGIGGKMVWDTLHEDGKEEEEFANERLDLKELLLMAVATSIDALAMGITFAFLSVSIGKASGLIGCTTFVISALGVFIGNRFGAKYKDKASLTGGIILILIGCKVLLEHLGILG